MVSNGDPGQGSLGVGKIDDSDWLIKMLLEDQCELFAQLFEKSAQPILITDKNELTVDVNPAFENLFGYKKEELLNRDAVDLRMYRQKRINRIKKYPARKTMTVEEILKEDQQPL